MDLTLDNSTELGKSIYGLLKESIRKTQVKRLNEFLKYVELRYEYMSPLDKEELNQKLNTEEGQEVLTNFSDLILKTSCSRVRMATALLYCEDSDFDFDKTEKITLITAMKEINDNLLDFLMAVSKLKRQKERTPYPRASVNHNNYESFSKGRWDKEAIFVYVNDLIKLRLLLPDPVFVTGAGEGWSASFGITDRSLKMISLFRKSEELLI